MQLLFSRLFWVISLSLVITITSIRFFLLPIDIANPDMAVHVSQRMLSFYTHVAASTIALALGGLQFVHRLRARRPRVHRWVGRIYVAAVALGALSGLTVAASAVGGPVAQAGFAVLAVVWAVTTLQAFRLALARDFANHRRWMIRSFALTFAAVTLRIQLFSWIALTGASYTEISPVLAWSSWIPNLILAEWLLRPRQASGVSA